MRAGVLGGVRAGVLGGGMQAGVLGEAYRQVCWVWEEVCRQVCWGWEEVCRQVCSGGYSAALLGLINSKQDKEERWCRWSTHRRTALVPWQDRP